MDQVHSYGSAAAHGGLPQSGARTSRALIVKFGAIGDVIMAIPGAAALYASGMTIDWVASEAIAPVLRLYPWIEVIPVDEPRLLRGSWPDRLGASLSLWRILRKQTQDHGPYDTLATLYYDRRYAMLTSGIPARRRVRLSQTDRRFALLPGRHHTDEYARILRGAPDTETPAQLAPVRVRGLPATSLAKQPGKTRVVLVPAGARNVLRDDALRRWPLGNYVALAADLLRAGFEVLLVGGPEDRWASPHFAAIAATSQANYFSDLIGQLSLMQTLALLDSSEVTVVHDTGPLHLAGITSTAIVTLFGPTDPHGRLPRRSNAVALWGGEGFACRPCYDGRDYAPCTHNGCMTQITPAQVLAEVLNLVHARAQGQRLEPRVLTPPPAPSARLLQIGQDTW